MKTAKETDKKFEINKLEYEEIGQNLRHLNDVRVRVVQNMLTGFGFLVAGHIAIATSASVTPVARSNLVYAIAALGVLVTLTAWLVEKRCVGMFDVLTERAIVLEEIFGEKRQISIISETDKRTLILSASGGVNFVFVASILFWGTSWYWTR